MHEATQNVTLWYVGPVARENHGSFEIFRTLMRSMSEKETVTVRHGSTSIKSGFQNFLTKMFGNFLAPLYVTAAAPPLIFSLELAAA